MCLTMNTYYCFYLQINSFADHQQYFYLMVKEASQQSGAFICIILEYVLRLYFLSNSNGT